MGVKRNELLNYIDVDSIDVERAVNSNRICKLNNNNLSHNPVFYLMTREQRGYDNWSLIFAQQLALEIKQPVVVLFFLDKSKKINSRKLDFMLNGLKQVKSELKAKNIEFKIIFKTEKEYIEYLKNIDIGCFVVDFSPLNEDKNLNELISKNIDSASYEVDSHNIIPCRYVSKGQEYSAATLRLKIKKIIEEFLTEYPKLEEHPYKFESSLPYSDLMISDFEDIEDKNVHPISWLKPSSVEAKKNLDSFLEEKLNFYNINRNDPTKDALSNMSVYLHFGQISSQRIALDVLKADASIDNKESYLEELIVRKELADNFCFYNLNYKNNIAFPAWAQSTLNGHKSDIRTYLYTLEEFENAKTHDELWNAAQMELLRMGKMHSYMRMYWCKKILEWSQNPKIAQETAIYLNDKYSLDGQDANGYAGIAWCIGGVHDRAWTERNVFGKIRYMNYEGCRRKFDIALYINIIKNIQ